MIAQEMHLGRIQDQHDGGGVYIVYLPAFVGLFQSHAWGLLLALRNVT